ncbi:hypothetical protein STENM223S_00251 [Streptomyces tendae]
MVATLVDPEDRTHRRRTSPYAAGTSRATLLGYSSADVPSCCPDVRETVKWRWDNGAFVRSTPSDGAERVTRARAHADRALPDGEKPDSRDPSCGGGHPASGPYTSALSETRRT